MSGSFDRSGRWRRSPERDDPRKLSPIHHLYSTIDTVHHERVVEEPRSPWYKRGQPRSQVGPGDPDTLRKAERGAPS